jgi:uncharacterized lipoprotein YmbA
MKKLTILALLLTGCASAPTRHATSVPDGETVTIQLSTGTAQELLLSLSKSLHPTEPIQIPDDHGDPRKFK